MEFHPEALFTEPGGYEEARFPLLGSIALFGIYAFFELLFDGGAVSTVVLGAGLGVWGIAEMLPTDRRRLASFLRMLAIGILLSVVVLSLIRLLS